MPAGSKRALSWRGGAAVGADDASARQGCGDHRYLVRRGDAGTGSHDFAVHELFVPTAYTVNTADDPPLHPGPLYRLPVIFTLCSSLGPLALGIARGAIDGFVELMAAKVDRFTGTALRERLTVQERVAKAEAAVRSARAFSTRWSMRSGAPSSRAGH